MDEPIIQFIKHTPFLIINICFWSNQNKKSLLLKNSVSRNLTYSSSGKQLCASVPLPLFKEHLSCFCFGFSDLFVWKIVASTSDKLVKRIIPYSLLVLSWHNLSYSNILQLPIISFVNLWTYEQVRLRRAWPTAV